MNVIAYMVIEKEFLDEIVCTINDMIAEGYVPQGGIAVSKSYATLPGEFGGRSIEEIDIVYAQAMVKFE